MCARAQPPAPWPPRAPPGAPHPERTCRQIDTPPGTFGIFEESDDGAARRLRDDEHPLEVRLQLGADEDRVRLVLREKDQEHHILSSEAQSFAVFAVAKLDEFLARLSDDEAARLETIRVSTLHTMSTGLCG